MHQITQPDDGFGALAKRLEIESPDQYAAAGNLLREVKNFQKVVEADLRPGIDAAHAAWKTSLANLQKHLEPAQAAEKVIKCKMSIYVEEQERIARAARAKALAEAEAKARAEREAAIQAAMAAAAAAAEERDEVTAAMAMDEAAAIEASPVVPVMQAAILRADMAISTGTTATVKYDFEVVSLAALPEEYKIADEKKIRRVVNAHKGQIAIPGVKITQSTQIRQRS